MLPPPSTFAQGLPMRQVRSVGTAGRLTMPRVAPATLTGH